MSNKAKIMKDTFDTIKNNIYDFMDEYNLKYKEIKDKILMEIYDIELNKKGKEDNDEEEKQNNMPKEEQKQNNQNNNNKNDKNKNSNQKTNNTKNSEKKKQDTDSIKYNEIFQYFKYE